MSPPKPPWPILASLAVLLAACGGKDTPPQCDVSAFPVPSWAKVAPEQVEAAKKAGVPVAFENALGMRFVLIPAGTFVMGSPAAEVARKDNETRHGVTLTKAYYLGITEVTQAVWEAVMGSNPSRSKGPTLPVTEVSWDDCQTFLDRLNGRVPGGAYRLPSEAEWERACRAGTTTRYWSGDAEADLARVGWYEENSGARLHEAGEKPASPWGLHDMHGNVWEWCEDWFAALPSGAVTDPTGTSGSGYRVGRGGCWVYPAWSARSAYRIGRRPGGHYFAWGFRLARTVTAK